MIDITPPMPETPPQLTVVDMVRASARKNPDQEALICGDERLNWSDFDTRINRVANALIARGIGKGDNVAVLSPNSIAYAELFMGIIRAGACITPLSTMASPDALEKMLADCGARMLFLANQYRDLAAPFLDRLIAEKVAIDFDASGFTDYEDMLDKAPVTDPMIPIEMTDAVNLIYSSGTTGTPKGILHNHWMRRKWTG